METTRPLPREAALVVNVHSRRGPGRARATGVRSHPRSKQAPPPPPLGAGLVVNVHSRRGQDLFEEATAKLEMAGVRLIASHALRNPKKLVPTVRQAVQDGAPMVIVGGGDGAR